MRTVGLREANQHFARVMRAVRRGEEVILLDRGRPIATLTPIRGSEDAVSKLVSRGLLALGRRPGPLPPFRSVSTKTSLSRAVIDERNESD